MDELYATLQNVQFHCTNTWGILIMTTLASVVLIEISISILRKLWCCIRPTSLGITDLPKPSNVLQTIPDINVIPPTPLKETSWIPVRRIPRPVTAHVIPNVNIIPPTPVKDIPVINITPPTPIKDELVVPATPISRTPSLESITESSPAVDELSSAPRILQAIQLHLKISNLKQQGPIFSPRRTRSKQIKGSFRKLT